MTTKAHTVITFMAGILKGVLQETFEQQQFIRIYIYRLYFEREHT